MVSKDTAICLRKVDYSETSQVVTFFTREHGKIGVMAKGAKRQKSATGGPVEVFSYGEIVFYPSDTGKLATLKEFDQKPMFMGLRRRLQPLNCALFGAELVDHFTHEHDPHIELFDSFVRFLTDVQETDDDRGALIILIVFQLTLLGDTGSGLVLDRCANCRADYSDQWQNVYFSSSANGLICPDCEFSFIDKVRLSQAAAGCLVNFRNLKEAGDRTVREIEKVLVYHFTEMLHKRPRMAKYFL